MSQNAFVLGHFSFEIISEVKKIIKNQPKIKKRIKKNVKK